MAIATLERLREHLQWAIELEHCTLPPYLCALYSIKPGHNDESVANIASVFLEEMLHMTLAANVLNAVGGQPVLDKPDFTPRYPAYLPHSARGFLVPLARFAPATVDTFMRIEKPEGPDAPAEDDRFDTIGQFYRALEDALRGLCATVGESAVFCGDPRRQVTPAMLDYPGSGRIVPVYDLASALAAIDEIEDQGEGLRHDQVWDGDRDMFHPDRDEVAHYFRFVEIKEGRLFQRGDTPKSGPTGPSLDVRWGEVHPMRDNPRLDDVPPGSPIRAHMDRFNRVYCDMLRGLHVAFNGAPTTIASTMGAMHEVRTLAQALMQMPLGDGTTAGPSFDYVPALVTATTTPEFSITVREDGPYVITGGVPLTKKSIVYSELHEPLTWLKTETLDSEQTYKLCRCGASSRKPFCDGTHRHIGFNGREHPPTMPTKKRQQRINGDHVTVTDDQALCMHAGFCGNRIEKVWDMVPRSGDTRVRFSMIQMIERCPSGRLGYELEGTTVEPDLPHAIAVVKDGPYWVTGHVPVTLSDGRTLEVRNRVTLCRCGQSSRKPLCDGTHVAAKFKD